MTQMLQVSKNSNIKYNIIHVKTKPKRIYQIELYNSESILSISDLATRQMQAYYVAAHHTIKTKKHTNYGNPYSKNYVNLQYPREKINVLKQ